MHRVRLLRIFSSLLVITLLLTMFGCAAEQPEEKPTIALAEANWTSQLVLTLILDQIISEQLGYPTTRTFAYGPIAWAGMDKGEFDIAAEIWFPARRAEIQPFLDKGTVELAGEIFGGAGNYWVVPRYVVEGDPARGIEPMAPDLKTILDLQTKEKGGKGYWKLFENPERPGLGELVGGEVGWVNASGHIILGYDLPLWWSHQSEAVQMARTIAADKKGEPILVVWWSPHVIFTQVDLIKLEGVDPDRQAEIDWDKDPYPLKTGFEVYEVYKVIRTGLAETAPDVYRLVHNMSVTEDEINRLTYRVDEEGEEMADVAADWISQNQDRIDQWLAE